MNYAPLVFDLSSPLSPDRFRSRFHFRRQDRLKSHFYFSELLPLIEPGSVLGRDEGEWRNASLDDCVGDDGDRECNPGEGDVGDMSIVSGKFSFKFC